jgi:hypothetical protein
VCDVVPAAANAGQADPGQRLCGAHSATMSMSGKLVYIRTYVIDFHGSIEAT